jgi:serine/threonine-protein kinase
MATVHLGRLLGPVGFSRTVAIKRSHPEMAGDPEFVSMFLDEARLAARIRHPNVVSTLDVVALEGELFLVMDFVQGESLSRLMRASKILGTKIPPEIARTIMAGALHGLHAAHEAKNERGEALKIVHRDVSPQNILIGVDGIARVLDFGVAKALGRIQTTRDGQIKGKLSYLAPEQLNGNISRQSDIYAASVVLWEVLTAERLFDADNPGDLLSQVLNRPVRPPSGLTKSVSPELDRIVLKGLARDPADRYATAREMAIELERHGGLVSAVEVGEWVERVAKDAIAARAKKVAEIEHYSADDIPEQLSSPRRPSPEEAAAIAAARARGALKRADRTVADVTPRGSRESSGDLRSSPTETSISSISTRPPAPQVRAGKTRIALVSTGILLLLLLATTFVRSSRRSNDANPVSASPAAPTGAAPTASAPIPTPWIAATDLPVAPASPMAASTSETLAPTYTTPHTSVTPPTKARAPVHGPAQPRHPTVDCSVPYVFDDKGIKHLRPECLN